MGGILSAIIGLASLTHRDSMTGVVMVGSRISDGALVLQVMNSLMKKDQYRVSDRSKVGAWSQ